MKTAWIIGVATAGLLAPAAVGAQESGSTMAAGAEKKIALEQAAAAGGAPATAERRMLIEQAAGGRGGVMAGPVETKITPGRPYSAESISETVQVLADGNRINRQSVTRVYRDGEGRTRRETLASDGSVRTIAISDPVAHFSYTLNPAAKTASKTAISIMRPQTYSLTTTRDGEQRHGTVTVQRGGGAGVGVGGGGARGGHATGSTLERTPASENPNVKKEELAAQDIEGVMATGSRTTTTIPAGEIGNAQPIRIVSEQWFSEELQLLVMTRHSDPRSGETTYRLRNIVRAEPDPSLFTVPPDYTVQERGIKRQE